MRNPAFHDKDSHYYTREKGWLLPFIGKGSNLVMDLGCASGRLGTRLLREGRAKEVIGVEIFEPAAEEASQTYRKVHVGDVEEMQLDYVNYFDYVVCGDILEHLKDPSKVVGRISKMLRPGGKLLVCVPNIRNFRILGNLIFLGEWEYVSSGILDQTHLRFFTRSSCRRMLTENGFQVYHAEMIVQGPKKTLLNRITFGLFSEFLANQIFCCGRKAETPPQEVAAKGY